MKKRITLKELANRLNGKPEKPVTYYGKAAIVEEKREREELTIQQALERSPNLAKLQTVQVAKGTWIAIKPERDAETARQNWQRTYNLTN